MQKLFFLLTSLLIFSCNGKHKIDLSKTYEGKVTYINEHIADHINQRDTSIYEDFLLVLDGGEFRRYPASMEGCKGTYAIIDNTFYASTDECACWCNCDPEVDCGGDLVLGTFLVVEFTENKLVLKSFFEQDYGENVGTYSVEKLIELDRQ